MAEADRETTAAAIRVAVVALVAAIKAVVETRGAVVVPAADRLEAVLAARRVRVVEAVRAAAVRLAVDLVEEDGGEISSAS